MDASRGESRVPHREPDAHALTWSEYVRWLVGDARQIDVAERTGIDQGTISRWLRGGSAASVSYQSARALARAYGRPVLEAFTIAGILDADETGIQVPLILSLRDVSTEDLLDELRRRTRARDRSGDRASLA